MLFARPQIQVAFRSRRKCPRCVETTDMQLDARIVHASGIFPKVPHCPACLQYPARLFVPATQTAQITRSTGIIPKIDGMATPWAGPLPGGGYEGKTKRLDQVVANAAQWLSDQFGLPVTIRYNSDRLAGGAWLVDPKRRDASVSIGAWLPTPEYVHRKLRRAHFTVRLQDVWTPTERSKIAFVVYIHVDFLKNHLDTGLAGTAGERGYWHLPSGLAARRCLLKRVDRSKVMAMLKPKRGSKAR